MDWSDEGFEKPAAGCYRGYVGTNSVQNTQQGHWDISAKRKERDPSRCFTAGSRGYDITNMLQNK